MLYSCTRKSTGLGGTLPEGHDTSKIESMQPIRDRVIRVRFNADTASNMQWTFKPQQSEIKVIFILEYYYASVYCRMSTSRALHCLFCANVPLNPHLLTHSLSHSLTLEQLFE